MHMCVYDAKTIQIFKLCYNQVLLSLQKTTMICWKIHVPDHGPWAIHSRPYTAGGEMRERATKHNLTSEISYITARIRTQQALRYAYQ